MDQINMINTSFNNVYMLHAHDFIHFISKGCVERYINALTTAGYAVKVIQMAALRWMNLEEFNWVFPAWQYHGWNCRLTANQAQSCAWVAQDSQLVNSQ